MEGSAGVAVNESEEFEFRLRAEQEAGGGGNGISSPPQGKKQIAASQQEPAFEKEARELAGTSTADVISAYPLVRVATSAVEPLMVGSDRLMGGKGERTTQLKEMQARGAKALGIGSIDTTVQDIAGSLMGPLGIGAAKAIPAAATAGGRIVQGTQLGALGGLTAEGESPGKQGTVGAVAGGGLTAAIEGLLKAPGALRSIASGLGQYFGLTAPKALPKAPTTAGAEKAIGELQTQRDVMGGEPAREGKAASQFERTKTDFDERMKPLREEAFRGSPVQAQGTLDMIESLKAKNPDAKVQRALQEVQDTITRATQGTQTSTLPAAGTRMTVEELRAAQGQGSSMSIEMTDEVRQSINRMISQKGDNALDKHTQAVLAEVRENLVGKSPESYRRYLDQFRQGARELDPFQPEVSVLGKVTGERGAPRLAGQDAQNSLEGVFAGKTAQRDFRQLVESTQHDPAALDGVRESLRKWIMPTDPSGKVNIAKAAAHWDKAKGAVQNSGLFEPEHYAAIDKVMTKLTTSEKGAEAAKAGAAGVAWVLGLPFGRPGSTAMLARTAVGHLGGGEKTPQQVESMVAKAMSDAQFAKLLAADSTRQNVSAIERALSGTAGQEMTQSRTRRQPDPLSMRPAGL